eukprot:3756966-Amphidinium_carterae.4
MFAVFVNITFGAQPQEQRRQSEQTCVWNISVSKRVFLAVYQMDLILVGAFNGHTQENYKVFVVIF